MWCNHRRCMLHRLEDMHWLAKIPGQEHVKEMGVELHRANTPAKCKRVPRPGAVNAPFPKDRT